MNLQERKGHLSNGCQQALRAIKVLQYHLQILSLMQNIWAVNKNVSHLSMVKKL